jgi:hypothetical protein
MQDSIRHYRFGAAGAGASSDALVALLFAPGEAEAAAHLAAEWRTSVPGVEFAGLELCPQAHRQDYTPLRQALLDMVRDRAIWPSRLILFGAGAAAALALALVFERAIWSVGVIGLDAPLDALSAAQSTSSRIRLVQRPAPDGNIRLQALLRSLRRSLIDVRAMTLPEGTELSSPVAARACGTFILEMVAHAGQLNAS